MTHAQTGTAVAAIILTGEKLATWLADHPGFIAAGFIAGFSFMLMSSIRKANVKRS